MIARSLARTSGSISTPTRSTRPFVSTISIRDRVLLTTLPVALGLLLPPTLGAPLDATLGPPTGAPDALPDAALGATLDPLPEALDAPLAAVPGALPGGLGLLLEVPLGAAPGATLGPLPGALGAPLAAALGALPGVPEPLPDAPLGAALGLLPDTLDGPRAATVLLFKPISKSFASASRRSLRPREFGHSRFMDRISFGIWSKCFARMYDLILRISV